MNDKQVKGFLKTVEEGSFSKAALFLFISPQALVQQINTLESEIGAVLLERSPRGVTCTPAGDYFYKNIKHLDVYLENTIAECKRLGSQPKEVLRVGVFSTPLFMPTFCFNFSMKYPSIHIKQVEINSENFYKLLLIDEIDILETGPFSILEGKGLRFTKLMDLQPVCIVAKNHPLAGYKTIEPKDLAGQTVAVPDIHFFNKSEEFAEEIKQIHFVDKIFGRESMVNTCLRGGVYIIPEPCALALRPLVSIPYQFKKLEIGLLSKMELTPTVQLFMDEAIEVYRDEGIAT